MMPTAVESGFEAAFWFIDRALNDGETLQPQKLQLLLFLAQGYFGVAHSGLKLMPATFVAAESGPIEPTLYRAFSRGKPVIDLTPVEEKPAHLMDSIWRQFGALSADKLTKLIKRHPPYIEAFEAGPMTEISFAAMVAFYGDQGLVRRKSAEPSPFEGQPNNGGFDAPSIERVMRPKVARNAEGKPVNVSAWSPKRVG
ncbi:MAG: hypothetical protein JNM81_17170 [Rhodospirillaceae bacterium]|nr:hypothetical protein [Rhodospirillaceae bacterium]